MKIHTYLFILFKMRGRNNSFNSCEDVLSFTRQFEVSLFVKSLF